MTDDNLAYVIAVSIVAFALGLQFGCILANRIIRAEYKATPVVSNQCYDDGYLDGSKGNPRRWNR